MNEKIQRPPADILYADELARLIRSDQGPIPPGWNMSPLAVEKFVLGDETMNISRKFVAPREQVTRIIITLATNRGAMLIGQPGTAKSWLSELIATAISGTSSLTIQGGTITHINQLLYSWNEAIMKNQGPCKAALIPSPIYQGMQTGKLVRFEEIARCAPNIQDAILSIMSERQLTIAEFAGDQSVLYAREGFNIIATSNSIDRGVHQMSAALKRRMNFETIQPIKNINDEIEVILNESNKLIKSSGVNVQSKPEVIEILATIFHELRNGQTLSGRSTDRLASAVMSTAEAVSVAHAIAVYAYYYRNGEVIAEDIVHFLVGASLKDNREDRRRMHHYFETEVANKEGGLWEEIYRHKKLLE